MTSASCLRRTSGELAGFRRNLLPPLTTRPVSAFDRPVPLLSRWLCCSVFGSPNLTTVKLTGVGGSFQKHVDAESKGIKAHFNMDESGVLLLDRVSSCEHLNHQPVQIPFAVLLSFLSNVATSCL